MPTVLWQSEDSWNNKFIIWSGTVLGTSNLVHADALYAYILTSSITRLLQGSGIIDRQEETINPIAAFIRWKFTNYLAELGNVMGSAGVYSPVATDDGPSVLYTTSIFPQSVAGWTAQATFVERSTIDVVSPDMPESPRFLIGFAPAISGKIFVINPLIDNTVSGYWSNWNIPLISGARITDLETVRII